MPPRKRKTTAPDVTIEEVVPPKRRTRSQGNKVVTIEDSSREASENETAVTIKTEPVDEIKPASAGLDSRFTTYLSNLHKYQQEALFCDAALKASDGGLVMTHACIVAAACPFLCHQLMDCKPSYMTVETPISSDLLNNLVEFIYKGAVSLPEEEKDSLLDSADILGLDLRKTAESASGDKALIVKDVNWSKNIFSTLREFQKKGLFCDAVLKSTVDGGLFTAHTCVVAASKNILSEELSASGFFPDRVLKIIDEGSEM